MNRVLDTVEVIFAFVISLITKLYLVVDWQGMIFIGILLIFAACFIAILSIPKKKQPLPVVREFKPEPEILEYPLPALGNSDNEDNDRDDDKQVDQTTSGNLSGHTEQPEDYQDNNKQF